MYLQEEAELYSSHPSAPQVPVYLCDQITFAGLGSEMPQLWSQLRVCCAFFSSEAAVMCGGFGT